MDTCNYDFEKNIKERLEVILAAENGDDVPFLVGAIRSLRRELRDTIHNEYCGGLPPEDRNGHGCCTQCRQLTRSL